MKEKSPPAKGAERTDAIHSAGIERRGVPRRLHELVAGGIAGEVTLTRQRRQRERLDPDGEALVVGPSEALDQTHARAQRAPELSSHARADELAGAAYASADLGAAVEATLHEVGREGGHPDERAVAGEGRFVSGRGAELEACSHAQTVDAASVRVRPEHVGETEAGVADGGVSERLRFDGREVPRRRFRSGRQPSPALPRARADR